MQPTSSTRTVLITGASGNLGRKLRLHFTALGWHLRLLDRRRKGDDVVTIANLAHDDESWMQHFVGVDAVVHLAADASPDAGWNSIIPNNMDATRNVLRAAQRHGVRRMVFASSNWVMAGYQFERMRLTADLPPRPAHPYGVSKLFGEQMGAYAAQQGLSFIALRIGYCQHREGNRPGPHMEYGSWGQLMWLSDRDMCQGMERAVLAEGVDYAVLNLVSDNPGMPWDIGETRRVIGYTPQDGAAAVVTFRVRHQDTSAEKRYRNDAC
ncbi:MAG: NAD(P)-dependent oxidoreductase [Alphaproteobacteria bacterium]|nr:NAD(P)-dependent oxidoreductase [Alphaproteobacteria bacterium]